MNALTTETVGAIRETADGSRIIEGIAVPYGQVALDTNLGAEAFAPGAFRDSVAHWMNHPSGSRLAFRQAHGEKAIGAVELLEDRAEGVFFRAAIRPGAAGDEYLEQVRMGLNGVSIEAGLNGDSKRTKDGTIVHRSARLHAIAGSITPAYDGARIALRDIDESEETVNETTAAEAVTTAPAPAPELERDAIERRDVETFKSSTSSIVITRPEPIYGAATGKSLLRDLASAHRGDSEAYERQSRYNQLVADVTSRIERAGDLLSSEIPGAYPSDTLPGLLTPRILKGRPMGGFFNRFAISDARPKVFAKVTTSTSVAVQAAEGTNPAATDMATTSVSVTPSLYGAYVDVSRQVIDGANPDAEAMLIQDLLEAYVQKSEDVIAAAVEAGASASGTAITAATPFDGCLGNVVKFYSTRFRPAQAQFIPSALYAVLLAQAGTDGRPLMPLLSPNNTSASVEAGATSGSIMGATAYLSYESTTNVVTTSRADDYVIYESPVVRFSYQEVAGPAAVRIGIWAYLGIGTRLGSLKVTAA